MFICLLLGGFSIGQAAPSLQDFSVALGAAGFIYDTIDRVSKFIDVAKDRQNYGPHKYLLCITSEIKRINIHCSVIERSNKLLLKQSASPNCALPTY